MFCLSCVFCDIVKGVSPSFKVYEDDKCLVILDKYPLTYGHLLVIPRKHYENLLEMDDDTAVYVCEVARKVAKIVVKVLDAKGVNIITNIGRAAGQVIFHAHIHIVPRYEGDGLRIRAKRLDIGDSEKESLADKLRNSLEGR